MLTTLTYRTIAEAIDIFKVTEKSQVAAGHLKEKKGGKRILPAYLSVCTVGDIKGKKKRKRVVSTFQLLQLTYK
jgi:hypothetical protein